MVKDMKEEGDGRRTELELGRVLAAITDRGNTEDAEDDAEKENSALKDVAMRWWHEERRDFKDRLEEQNAELKGRIPLTNAEFLEHQLLALKDRSEEDAALSMLDKAMLGSRIRGLRHHQGKVGLLQKWLTPEDQLKAENAELRQKLFSMEWRCGELERKNAELTQRIALTDTRLNTHRLLKRKTNEEYKEVQKQRVALEARERELRDRERSLVDRTVEYVTGVMSPLLQTPVGPSLEKTLRRQRRTLLQHVELLERKNAEQTEEWAAMVERVQQLQALKDGLDRENAELRLQASSKDVRCGELQSDKERLERKNAELKQSIALTDARLNTHRLLKRKTDEEYKEARRQRVALEARERELQDQERRLERDGARLRLREAVLGSQFHVFHCRHVRMSAEIRMLRSQRRTLLQHLEALERSGAEQEEEWAAADSRLQQLHALKEKLDGFGGMGASTDAGV